MTHSDAIAIQLYIERPLLSYVRVIVGKGVDAFAQHFIALENGAQVQQITTAFLYFIPFIFILIGNVLITDVFLGVLTVELRICYCKL